MLVYALVEGTKLECVCDLRLPAETGVYTLLMVYDWASLESLNRPLFKECGEELGPELDILINFKELSCKIMQVPVRMGSWVFGDASEVTVFMGDTNIRTILLFLLLSGDSGEQILEETLHASLFLWSFQF